MHDIDIVYVILTHLGAGTHDVVIGEIHWNSVQYYVSPDNPDPFISLLLILLCGLVWFYSCKCHNCLPISAHGLWEWLMILTLFAQLKYVNVLHWIVGLYYYGFVVNEGICLILVIQTFYPSTLSVLYNKGVYTTSSIVWSTTGPLNIFKSHETT